MRTHSRSRAMATGALLAAGALVTAAVQAAPAAARTDAPIGAPAGAHAKPDPGSLPVKLSPGARAKLIEAADAGTADTADSLGLGAKEELRVRDVVKDADGSVHTRYERTYAGLPVLGGDLVVDAAPSGRIESVAESSKARLRVPTTKAAKAAPFAAGTDRKVVWAAKGTPRLAWESVVKGTQADGTPSRMHVITDAATGKEIFRYEGIETGTGNSIYSGRVTIGTSGSGPYTMTDTGRGDHKTYNLNHRTSGTGTLFTDSDDVWGDGTNGDPASAGVDAQYGAALTWDYYKNVHGRTGIRGDGVGAYSRVHYGNNYVNAFWDDSCFCMTYGDGSGNAKPLTAIDVAAHEMSHGVTSATADLTYSGESGGLNEATSDIFATAVEFYADNASDPGDYLIGEKIDINGDGTPLRYQDRPSRDGASKDSWYSGIGGIDVHYSSGPANHWFYLASEGSGPKDIGGVHYDSPTSDGLPVTPIGRANAEKVWFKALTERMTSNTDYAGARDATLWAAGQLFGTGSATYNNVANAWAAINVGDRIADGVTVTDPGDQTSIVNQPVSLQIQATSSNAGALGYSATGLPAGLSIGSSTGLISGTPTTTGSSDVTVTVRDSAGRTGTASFTWTVNTTGGNVFESTADVDIPDAGAAVTSPVTVSRSGNAPSALKVGVNIVHTYRGDLVIDLLAPDGSAYRLKNSNIFDWAADVHTTYTVNASSEAASGTWKLRVRDVYSGDTGYIDSWKLTF